jgi:hypothetical protein
MYFKHFFYIFLQFTHERTQSSAWLWSDLHPMLNKISQRLEQVTGLSVANPELGSFLLTSSEAYQVR